MKYAVLIGDGMADLPLAELGNKTPLEVANTPNMDAIVKAGQCGMVCNVPQGMTPGSDVAAMSIFGYDPAKYYSGRGPLEAASLGIEFKDKDVAFRCNLVYVKDGVMEDFTSGHISTEEAAEILDTLNKELVNQSGSPVSGSPVSGSPVSGSPAACSEHCRGVRFYLGLSYRHIAMLNNVPTTTAYTPPHDITGKLIANYLPSGEGAELLKVLMEKSVPILAEHPVNKKRIKEGKKPATMIWLWGQGGKPALPSFKEKFGKSGAVITAVHLIKGLGKLTGLDVIDVPGVTGFIDTNYKGKADYALKALETKDLVFVHVEAPDEAGHMGDIKIKIQAIEDFDSKIVGPILKGLGFSVFSDVRKSGSPDVRILVLPDHPTPIVIKSHTADPVPYAFCGKGVQAGKAQVFAEKEIENTGNFIPRGFELLKNFLS